MKKILCILLSILILTSSTAVLAYVYDGYEDDERFETTVAAKTYEATNISDTSAILRGSYEEFDYEMNHVPLCIISLFDIWEDGSDEIRYNVYLNEVLPSNGYQRFMITGLKPSTTYHYRITKKSNTETFTTLSEPMPATVTTAEKREQGYEFTIRPQSLDKYGSVFVALYKDGKCLHTFRKNLLYDIANVNTDITEFDYAKIFLWQNNSLKPLTTPELIYMSDIK